MAKPLFCGIHGVPEPCEACAKAQPNHAEEKYRRLLEAMQRHTAAMEKVTRMLEAAGVRDPGPGAVPRPLARFPGAAQAPGAAAMVVEHLARAFPPDYLRGLAEDLADELARSARRRRRR